MRRGMDTFISVQSNTVKKHFYTHCSEDDCSNTAFGNKNQVDPVLKLYPRAPLMHTKNSSVTDGKANGSRLIFQKLYLKRGEYAFYLLLDNGTTILAVFASQCEGIEVEFENKGIEPNIIQVEPRQFQFKCRIQDESIGLDEIVGTRGAQFPGRLVSSRKPT